MRCLLSIRTRFERVELVKMPIAKGGTGAPAPSPWTAPDLSVELVNRFLRCFHVEVPCKGIELYRRHRRFLLPNAAFPFSTARPPRPVFPVSEVGFPALFSCNRREVT